MSGHSKWKQIQHQKGITDKKRGALFSKILKAISIAARDNPDPAFNPRLRSMIQKARENAVPNDNIERAIKRSSEEKNLEEVTIEAFGPEGSALVIQAITDSTNRTIAEVRKILTDHEAKMGAQGSAMWAFDKSADGELKAKFPQAVSEEAKRKLSALISVLEEHEDIERVFTNVL